MKNSMALLTLCLSLVACEGANTSLSGNLSINNNSHLFLVNSEGETCKLPSGHYRVTITPQSNEELTLEIVGKEQCRTSTKGTLIEDKFFSSVAENGQKYSIGGFTNRQWIGHEEKPGTAECTGVGTCSMYNVSKSKFEFGVYTNCPGVKEVIYNVDTYSEQTKIIFESHYAKIADAQFYTPKKNLKEVTVKESTSSCKVGLSVSIGVGFRIL